MLVLELLYYPEKDERPLRVARVEDRRVLRRAVKSVLERAESAVQELVAIDDHLASMQLAEVDRLKRVFAVLEPGDASPSVI